MTLLQQAVRQFEERQFDAALLGDMGIVPIEDDNEFLKEEEKQ